jgi:hypothetical protein
VGDAFLLGVRSVQYEGGTTAILRASVGEITGFRAEVQAGWGQLSKNEVQDCVNDGRG